MECPRIMSTDLDVSSCKIGRELLPHRAVHRIYIESSDRPREVPAEDNGNEPKRRLDCSMVEKT